MTKPNDSNGSKAAEAVIRLRRGDAAVIAQMLSRYAGNYLLPVMSKDWYEKQKPDWKRAWKGEHSRAKCLANVLQNKVWELDHGIRETTRLSRGKGTKKRAVPPPHREP